MLQEYSKVVYVDTYNEHQILIISHEYPDAINGWLCGYVEVLSTDKQYSLINKIHQENSNNIEDINLYAPGGLTYLGDLQDTAVANNINKGSLFIGFDTAHPFMEDFTVAKVKNSCKVLIDELTTKK